MTSPLYFSRARLRRDAPVAALRDLLMPDDQERRIVAGHRVVWTLFADRPDRERDFLWREAGDGFYYMLSARPPEDRHGMFELDPPKLFAPALAAGDRLCFSLRANATVARMTEGRGRGKPSDVVMDALYRIPKGAERAAARRGAVETAGQAWLHKQGVKAGFSIETAAERAATVRVVAYHQLRLDHKRSDMRIGVIDFEGELTITEPSLFMTAVSGGFGRAKAFGCGLMLIRRR